MTMQYTQGPWWFETKWCDRVNSDDGAICIITEDNAKGVNRTKLANRANARLIAAAPDLLEALKELFADYKSLADSGDAGFWSLEEQDVGKKAISAIAKATGEQA